MGVSFYFRFCLGLICVIDISVSTNQEIYELYQLFEEFTSHFNKSYITNATEYDHRFKIFKKNVEASDRLNNAFSTIKNKAVYGITKFSDLSPNEFKAKYLSSYVPKFVNKVNSSTSNSRFISLTAKSLGIPDKVDWRSRGVLTPIKNQEQCGACWAFSVVETMETIQALQYNTSVQKLSVQEMIDCDLKNYGCAGGDICNASTWAKSFGIVQESHYPLTDHTDSCKQVPKGLPIVTVNDSTCLSYVHKEDSLLVSLINGPVAVAVDATTWHSYVSGIIRFHCSDFRNHAVSIVGYDLTGEVPYYIVRNSWGSDFGDHGYLYIKVGDNLCGIASEVSTIKSVNMAKS